MEQQRILFAIASYLKSLKQDDTAAVQGKAIDSMVGLLESAFNLKETAESFSKESFYPISLSEIMTAGCATLKLETPAEALASVENNPKFQTFLDVVKSKGYFEGAEPGSLDYLQRQAKLVLKFKEKAASGGASQLEREKLAEDKKGLGNNAISIKDYEGAVQLYTEALELSPDGPSSHVYYCNRAAAQCHLNNYIEAVEDCQVTNPIILSYPSLPYPSLPFPTLPYSTISYPSNYPFLPLPDLYLFIITRL